MTDLKRRREVQERLALTLSRLSPVSAYQLAAMDLAGTDLAMKSRNEEAMTRYREDWLKHVQAKQAETGEMGGFVQIEISSETGLKIGGNRGDERIDLSDMPRFSPVRMSAVDVLPAGVHGPRHSGAGRAGRFSGSVGGLLAVRCEVNE